MDAYKYGQLAYKKGIHVVCDDTEFIRACLGERSSPEDIKAYQEWRKGHDNAAISAMFANNVRFCLNH